SMWLSTPNRRAWIWRARSCSSGGAADAAAAITATVSHAIARTGVRISLGPETSRRLRRGRSVPHWPAMSAPSAAARHLDRLLPDYDVHEVHSIRVRAQP